MCGVRHPTTRLHLTHARSDHTTGSRNIKPEVVFKVQKKARCASFCLIMDPFKGEVPVFARLWPVRVSASFTTGVVRSAILATAGLLVLSTSQQSAGCVGTDVAALCQVMELCQINQTDAFAQHGDVHAASCFSSCENFIPSRPNVNFDL